MFNNFLKITVSSLYFKSIIITRLKSLTRYYKLGFLSNNPLVYEWGYLTLQTITYFQLFILIGLNNGEDKLEAS